MRILGLLFGVYYGIKVIKKNVIEQNMVTYWGCLSLWQGTTTYIVQTPLNTTVNWYFGNANELCSNLYGPYLNNYNIFLATAIIG